MSCTSPAPKKVRFLNTLSPHSPPYCSTCPPVLPILIAAHPPKPHLLAPPTGSLVLLKTLYDATRQESLVISEQELKLSEDTTTTDATSGEPPAIIHMQLLGNGTDAARDAVYVGTTEALYRFPVANCGQFSGDCCACVASRDPHCAYDPVENKCVSVYGGVTGIRLLQDVANGDIAVCSAPPGSNETTPTPTRAVETPVTVETKTEDPYSTVGAKQSPTSEPGEWSGTCSVELDCPNVKTTK